METQTYKQKLSKARQMAWEAGNENSGKCPGKWSRDDYDTAIAVFVENAPQPSLPHVDAQPIGEVIVWVEDGVTHVQASSCLKFRHSRGMFNIVIAGKPIRECNPNGFEIAYGDMVYVCDGCRIVELCEYCGSLRRPMTMLDAVSFLKSKNTKCTH